jgi:hypothetical protein
MHQRTPGTGCKTISSPLAGFPITSRDNDTAFTIELTRTSRANPTTQLTNGFFKGSCSGSFREAGWLAAMAANGPYPGCYGASSGVFRRARARA